MTKPQVPPAPPAKLVIFGGLGDLTKRLLVPALANMAQQGLLTDNLSILVIDTHQATEAEVRKGLGEFVSKESQKGWSQLKSRIGYIQGDFTQDALFNELKVSIGPENAAFYLATPPRFFSEIVTRLGKAGLMNESKKAFRRVIIEKPFGHDLKSARQLNADILQYATESQIYRIDHFLGKETVQNILVLRFANSLLEAMWNSRYIDHVQITAAEAVDVGTRGAFYDTTGALRDMVPNHLFQLLAMIGMEPPNSFGAEAIRAEKAKLLAAIRKATPDEAKRDSVRGQYTAGKVEGKKVAAYTKAANVSPDSSTETYVALKLYIDSWRWADVPFYIRTGKALAIRDTEIVVQFKPVPPALFRDIPSERLPPNRLIIQIQPKEGIRFQFLAKQPGPIMETSGVDMAFRYADMFDLSASTGYETLLYDVLIGDQTLFQSAAMIESGWAAVQPFLDAWKRSRTPPEKYAAGSNGPKAADQLLTRDGRQWNAIGA